MKRTNWTLTWFRNVPAIACHAEFDAGEFDGDTHAETYFVWPGCPRERCGEGDPGVGCGCNGLFGDGLTRFQISVGPSWWCCWDDDVFDAEPVEADEVVRRVPLALLAEWHDTQAAVR